MVCEIVTPEEWEAIMQAGYPTDFCLKYVLFCMLGRVCADKAGVLTSNMIQRQVQRGPGGPERGLELPALRALRGRRGRLPLGQVPPPPAAARVGLLDWWGVWLWRVT